jgi:hypothetical protein
MPEDFNPVESPFRPKQQSGLDVIEAILKAPMLKSTYSLRDNNCMTFAEYSAKHIAQIE